VSFPEIPPYKQLQRVGFGPGYTAVDALILYMMIRHIRPKRYIEVGSGLSTYYCSLAAARNTSEGYPLAITCIEPYPFEKLRTIPNIDIMAKQVQDVEVSFFGQLQKDDVLFIDSSHVLKIDGDVPFLYLEVLPTLNVGVVVHIHDYHFRTTFLIRLSYGCSVRSGPCCGTKQWSCRHFCRSTETSESSCPHR
jgi:hypothetical protein